jgi:hypothetical protein
MVTMGDGNSTARTRARIRAAVCAVSLAAVALLSPSAASASGLGTGLANIVQPMGIAHGMGLIPTKPPRPSASAIARLRSAALTLPASVDLTANAMPPGNQGAVGSCAAWATGYTALGYWANVEGIAGGPFAPMYTYSQVTGGVDRGSTIEGNLTIDEQQGLDVQSDYWQGNFDYWDMPLLPERGQAVNWKLTHFANLLINPSASSTVTQQSIEAALAAGTPVTIGIPVYSNFFSVSSANQGYYAGISGSLAGYHAVTALGYDSTGLVIENSWGTGWGNGGFATLSWSFVNGYVFDAVAVSQLATGQPVSTAAPAVSGTPQQGQTLTASTGTWSPSATSYAYQWQWALAGSSQWHNTAGATSATFVPGTGALGLKLRVQITAANAGGQGASTSAAVGPIASGAPANTTAPTVSGTFRVGQTLTATAGSWSPTASSFTYQWQRSTNSGSTWTNILGATAARYVTTMADANADLRVLVAGMNLYGAGHATAAAPVGPVSGTPYSVSVPVVTGTPRQGQPLTASTGVWSPGGTSYQYQWQRLSSGSWVSVAGATAATYWPGAAALGEQIRVQVTAVNPYGQVTVNSGATGAVTSGAPANTSAPVISGSAIHGQPLVVTQGLWNAAVASIGYQWQRSTDGGASWVAVPDTTATYTPTVGDVNAKLRALVSATNAFGSNTAASAATAAIR